jgi:hypothetical protein
LPFLRFTRDKRGYETTSLVHAGRRGGRSRPRILYWFRTPPGVKVGRPALDQDAIRWIEEHNPDIEFDWPKILEAQPPAAPPANAKAPARQADEARNRRGRRDKPRPASDGVRPPPPPAPEHIGGEEPEPARPEPELERELEPMELEPMEPEPEPELELDPLAALAFEQLTHPEAEEKIDPPAMPLEQHVGREQLTRLRARYAELLARIVERGGDPERVEALRTQAESLNPDTWVTDEEVRQGIEAFEPKIRDLRAALGLRRRRRSRRGGRRRRGEGQGAKGEGQGAVQEGEGAGDKDDEGSNNEE